MPGQLRLPGSGVAKLAVSMKQSECHAVKMHEHRTAVMLITKLLPQQYLYNSSICASLIVGVIYLAMLVQSIVACATNTSPLAFPGLRSIAQLGSTHDAKSRMSSRHTIALGCPNRGLGACTQSQIWAMLLELWQARGTKLVCSASPVLLPSHQHRCCPSSSVQFFFRRQ